MKNVLLSSVFLLLLTGCQKEYFETKKETRNTLSIEQKILKTNLDKAALLIAKVVTSKDSKNELQDVFNSKANYHSISFKDIISNDNKSVKVKLSEFSKKVNEVFNSSKENGDLINYLSQNGCRIYIPYPLDWYSTEKPITVAGHPIDNDIEGIGYYCTDSKEISEATVNEDYADINPVILIMPEEESEGSIEYIINSSNFDKTPEKGSTVYEVKIGEIKCASFCGGIFEGDLEIRIARGTPVYDVDNDYLTGSFSTVIAIKYPREYAKSAKNKWTVYKNGGWFPVYIPWDTNWSIEKDNQAIAVWEYDKKHEITIEGTVGYKKDLANATITAKAKLTTTGDFLGIGEWNRAWFFSTNRNQGNGDITRNGWVIRKTSSEFEFTTPSNNYIY